MHEIIINKSQEKKDILLLENGIIVEKYEESENYKRLEGNIYVGKVQNVLQGMQAAFINIGEGKNTYIHLKDVLPKVDEKNNNSDSTNKVNIKDIIKPGMELLVQVKRDSTNNKGAKVSTHISLPGKYVVFMPETTIVTISQKIDNKEEKSRLEQIAKKYLPKGCGAIVRTSAKNKSEEIIEKDIKELAKKWQEILDKKNSKDINVPQLIYKNDDLVKKIFIDMIERNINRVTVNDKEIFEDINKIIKQVEIKNKIEVEIIENKNLLEQYYLTSQLDNLNNRKIWLKCGGFITIDKTEALIAIDVNSGKFTGTKNLEQTAFTVNSEATIEIAKQLRLRDLGGMIIIDYIDMKEKENKSKISDLLIEELKKDRSKTQVFGFTNLNLLEMTRKHICSNE